MEEGEGAGAGLGHPKHREVEREGMVRQVTRAWGLSEGGSLA